MESKLTPIVPIPSAGVGTNVLTGQHSPLLPVSLHGSPIATNDLNLNRPGLIIEGTDGVYDIVLAPKTT